MAEPLVSVVVPAYNCAAYIGDALQSILAQTHGDFEIIAVDDASTDDTLQILERFAGEDSRVKILTSADNLGQGACRNRATREARGRYIAFLDADDIWLPQKLVRQLDYMSEAGLAFSFCGYGTIDEQGRVIIPDLKIPRQTSFTQLLKSNTICPSSVIYDRQLLGDLFMAERPVRREDLICWLEVGKKLDGPLLGIPEPLCMVRRIRGSSSSNKLRTLSWQWAVYRKVAGFGRLRSLAFLAIFAFTSLAKRTPATVALKRHRN